MAKKIIVAGSRSFADYNLAKKILDELIPAGQDTEIVSGTAKGGDQLGERYANEKGYTLKKFPADWARFKKRAGFVRNEQMAKYADVLVAFWDGKSRGTAMMIELAKERNLVTQVVMVAVP